jgi:3-isopropylmalate dehydrogenase
MPLIAVLPGDGIGPEVTTQARRVLEALDLGLQFEEAPVGGAAYLVAGRPLPPDTLALAKRANAVLFGAIGDPRFEALERQLRPEAALLGIRRELGLFANLRPATLFPGLEDASPLKPEVVANLDIVIVRELDRRRLFRREGPADQCRGSPPGLRRDEL